MYESSVQAEVGQCLKQCRAEGLDREAVLFRLATTVEGVYVPQFYDSPAGCVGKSAAVAAMRGGLRRSDSHAGWVKSVAVAALRGEWGWGGACCYCIAGILHRLCHWNHAPSLTAGSCWGGG